MVPGPIWIVLDRAVIDVPLKPTSAPMIIFAVLLKVHSFTGAYIELAVQRGEEETMVTLLPTAMILLGARRI